MQTMEDDRPRAGKAWVLLGPLLAGVVGGVGVALPAFAALSDLGRNIAATYAQFPQLSPPALAALQLPRWITPAAFVLGAALALAAGPLVDRFVRGRDAWDDAQAGITAGLGATLTALVVGLGPVVVLALSVVPSIADLTLLGSPTELPAARYADLKETDPTRQGGTLMAKVVSDQIDGTFRGVGAAVLLALLAAGAVTLIGTLAAGYLRRRGWAFRACVLPYLELTALPAVTATLLGSASLMRGADVPVALGAAAVLALTSVVAVTGGWPVVLRVCVVLTWGVLVGGAADVGPAWLGVVAVVLTAALVVRQRWQAGALPAVAS